MANANWDVTVQTVSNESKIQKHAVNVGCLVRIHPMDLENKMVRISSDKTSIGREPSSDIFCDDKSVSREHAFILKSDAGFVIKDARSTNGTFVDGAQIIECQLTDGCKIQVGNHIFKFLAGDSIESQYHETVYSMMTKDGLTNVYNKRYLVDAVAREFERSQAYGRPFSMIMMDIDHFKSFNDTHGHLAGDEVLQEFAKRLESQCGPNQIVARFGGEEFSVLLVETEIQAAAKLAEKLRRCVMDTPFECCAGSLSVTASFGVAEYRADSHQNFGELFEQADQHLYAAKKRGRNQVAIDCDEIPS